jgi:hypothetical protein
MREPHSDGGRLEEARAPAPQEHGQSGLAGKRGEETASPQSAAKGGINLGAEKGELRMDNTLGSGADNVPSGLPPPKPRIPSIETFQRDSPALVSVAGKEARSIIYELFSDNEECILIGAQTVEVSPGPDGLLHRRRTSTTWFGNMQKTPNGLCRPVRGFPSELQTDGMFSPTGIAQDKPKGSSDGDVKTQARPRVTIHTRITMPIVLTGFSFPTFPDVPLAPGVEWHSPETYGKDANGKGISETKYKCVGFARVNGIETAVIKRETVHPELPPQVCQYYVSLADGMPEYIEYEYNRICVEDGAKAKSTLYVIRRR